MPRDVSRGAPLTTQDRRCAAVAGTVVGLGGLMPLWAAPGFLQPALEPLPPPLPAQMLVELLKHPFCVGPARRLVLGQLSRHYGRPFTDQWDLVRFASEQQLGLDFTTPPQLPRSLAGER